MGAVGRGTSIPASTSAARVFAIVATVYVIAAALLVFLPLVAANCQPIALVAGIDHLVIAVSDRARSDRFYAQVLGAQVEERGEGRVSYRIGEQRLNVHQAGAAAAPLAAEPVRPGNSDLCFVWPGSPESAMSHLLARGIQVVEGPVARTGAHGVGTSVYCRDPDGSLIELISYRG